MADDTIREPEQIRADCARKLRSVETGGMFTAILSSLPGENWSTPQIEEMRITPDRCLLARVEDEVPPTIHCAVEADQTVPPLLRRLQRLGLCKQAWFGVATVGCAHHSHPCLKKVTG
jgi:hypothetical protein